MVMMTPSTAATMPKPGIASPICVNACGTAIPLVVLLLEIHLQDLRKVVVLDGPGEQHLQRIGETRKRVVLLVEGGVLLEHLTGARILDVHFEPDQPFLARRLEHIVEYLQQLLVRLFSKGRRFEQTENFREDPLDQRRRVGDHHRAQPRATNDDQHARLFSVVVGSPQLPVPACPESIGGARAKLDCA